METTAKAAETTPAKSALTRWLAAQPSFVLALFGGAMAFGAYFAMYAFRKPFTAASFAEVGDFVVDYKIALVIAQVIGYALSKFIGIKVISELPLKWRAMAILVLIGISELALWAFAYVPSPYNIAMMFLNGLPLGMIWGLVFSFIEGRRISEIIGSILCASFIVSSGVVKSVGKWLMLEGYATDFTMPALTGLLFAPLLLFCVWGLTQMPDPNDADVAARVKRAPMNKAERSALFKAYAPGLIGLIGLYVMLTALRDFRDNFAAEIWADVGMGDKAEIFSLSELPIGLAILCAMAFLSVFKSNRTAIVANIAFIGLGLALTAGASLAYMGGLIDPLGWMIALGGGLYLAYTPYNGLMFDRLLAATGRVGTAGFLIYVADSSGYAGSVALLLFKNFSGLELPWAQFLTYAAIITGVIGLLMLIYATSYFLRRFPKA